MLCYLNEMTHGAAARELEWPTGTVATRSRRALVLLHHRLTRRGVTLSVAALAALLKSQHASAAVPPALLEKTVRTVMRSDGASAASASGGWNDRLNSIMGSRWCYAASTLTGIIIGLVLFPPTAISSSEDFPDFPELVRAMLIDHDPAAVSVAPSWQPLTVCGMFNPRCVILASDHCLMAVPTDLPIAFRPEMRGQQVFLRKLYDRSGRIVQMELLWFRLPDQLANQPPRFEECGG